MRALLLSLLVGLAGCQSTPWARFALQPEDCTALDAWARSGPDEPQTVQFMWVERTDVISMRPDMRYYPNDDEFDSSWAGEVYGALGRYTHGSSLDDLAGIATRCLHGRLTQDRNDNGEVAAISSDIVRPDSMLEIRWQDEGCGFVPLEGTISWGGCLTLRASRRD